MPIRTSMPMASSQVSDDNPFADGIPHQQPDN